MERNQGSEMKKKLAPGKKQQPSPLFLFPDILRVGLYTVSLAPQM